MDKVREHIYDVELINTIAVFHIEFKDNYFIIIEDSHDEISNKLNWTQKYYFPYKRIDYIFDDWENGSILIYLRNKILMFHEENFNLEEIKSKFVENFLNKI